MKKNKPEILLLTPPLTQLNTPYPATAYLSNYLQSEGYKTYQADIGLELILKIFTRKNLNNIFSIIENSTVSHNKTFQLREYYLSTIESVIKFLQNKDPMMAHRICSRQYLPESYRFDNLEEDMDWAFGTLGLVDRARYLSTLYIEDLNDLINHYIDEDFTISRYAEKIATSATNFAPIDDKLKDREESPNIIDQLFEEIIKEKIELYNPDLVTVSIPFPGNLFYALKAGKYIKDNYPEIKISMGGGYVNTELREISANAFFNYTDFLTLDDGESPLLNICRFITGEIPAEDLHRTFMLKDSQVVYVNNQNNRDVSQLKSGFPNYKDLPLDKYLSFIELANPMHRLWSDGRWNKLTLAKGCYWHRCTFCDTNLNYIKCYEPVSATIVVDRIETIIEQTGTSGFHFVDEAAPPAILKELAIEILKRKLTLSWWTNIRFEKNFTEDLCKLLAESGCIAVSGGLEVASNKILKQINKGVSIEQAAVVSHNFAAAGIMCHAYLMYGFPGQDEQETIDSLEIVRQLFSAGSIQSCYWHRFSMTAHSPIGKNPDKFNIKKIGPVQGDFAYNDLFHEEEKSIEHGKYSEGLKKAVYNYMHGVGMDFPLSSWFDFKVKKTTHRDYLIENILSNSESKKNSMKDAAELLWTGNSPQLKKGKNNHRLIFTNRTEVIEIETSYRKAKWIHSTIVGSEPLSEKTLTIGEVKKSYESTFEDKFENFLNSREWEILRANRLLVL